MDDRHIHVPQGALVDRGAADEYEFERSRRRRRPQSARRLAFGVTVALVVYYLVSLVQVTQAGRDRTPPPSDAIVVLGAAQYDGRPSPQLAARLDHVVTLWNEGVAPVVMVTGGKQPDDRFTEAEASRRYLVDRGVPDDVILMENIGRTTYQSLELASTALLGAGRDRVVLVSDPFHLKRSELIADGFGLDAVGSATPTSVVDGWQALRHDLEEAGGVAVGRIIGFERLSGLAG